MSIRLTDLATESFGMAKQGREFEKLVSRIEHWLSPKGAVVQSPDYIEDKITGQKREVDASIRYKVGSSPILITIESRDRSRKQDVRWIEEIAAKRDSIGADKTIAVSSSGFSEPAIKKAQSLGIEVRVIEDITESEAGEWAEKTRFTIKTIEYAPRGIAFDFDTDVSVTLDPAIKNGFEDDPQNFPLLHENISDQPISLSMLLRKLAMTGFDFTEGLQVGAPKVQKELEIAFEENPGVYTSTDKGRLGVSRLLITVEIAVKHEEKPQAKVIQYSSSDEAVIQMAQINVGANLVLTYSQEPPEDLSDVIMIPGGAVGNVLIQEQEPKET